MTKERHQVENEMQDKIEELKKTQVREMEELKNKASQSDESAKEI